MISFCCSRRSRLPHTTVARNISNPNNNEFKVLKDRLNQAISQENTRVIEESLSELIDKNVCINEPLTPKGSTALMIAAQNGHIAAQNGHKEIVKLLLEKDADANLAHNNGRTALMIAAERGHKEIVELFLGKMILGLNNI